jgi:membrane-associated protein
LTDAEHGGSSHVRAVLASLIDVAASPWVYLAIVALVALDGVVPVVPGEASVISAGALAGSGDLSLTLVVGAGALGAIAGDDGAFAVGRVLGPRLEPLIARSRRAADRRTWAEARLDARAPTLIVLSRFVPGGRTATTAGAGLLRLEWGRFLRLSAYAAITWASFIALLGFVGGAAFEEQPLLGLALGFAFALVATTVLSYGIRRRGPGDATDARQ